MSQTTKPTDSTGKDSDLKCSNYESLFDSGYNSNMQSSSFLELDSSTSISSDHHHHMMSSSGQSRKGPQPLPQWSDSGLSITDSGLGIVEDDRHHDHHDDEEKSLKKTPIISKQLSPADMQKQEALKSWLANNNNVADA